MAGKIHRHVYKDDWHMVRLDKPPAPKRIWPEILVDGWWIKKAPPESLKLYRIDEIDPKQEALVVEGEKCCDAAWAIGLQAVTSAFGSKCAHKSDWSPLAECDVVLCPDNDSSGFSYIDSVAREILAINPNARLRTLTLPDLDKGDDIADFIKKEG